MEEFANFIEEFANLLWQFANLLGYDLVFLPPGVCNHYRRKINFEKFFDFFCDRLAILTRDGAARGIFFRASLTFLRVPFVNSSILPPFTTFLGKK